jgi:hypothetical protein
MLMSFLLRRESSEDLAHPSLVQTPFRNGDHRSVGIGRRHLGDLGERARRRMKPAASRRPLRAALAFSANDTPTSSGLELGRLAVASLSSDVS